MLRSRFALGFVGVNIEGFVYVARAKKTEQHPTPQNGVPYLFLWLSLFACRFVRQQSNKKCIKSVWVWEETTAKQTFRFVFCLPDFKELPPQDNTQPRSFSHLHGRCTHSEKQNLRLFKLETNREVIL